MTVESPTTPTPTIETSQVPATTAKPYDDEIFNSYEASSAVPAEEPKAEEPKAEEPDQPLAKEEDKTEEQGDEGDKKPEEINKATKDDKVDDGLEDLTLSRTINGKEVKFKIKEAAEAYLRQEKFNRDMDRRITNISQREQAWKKDQDSFKQNITKLIEKAQEGDFITAVSGFAKIATFGTDLDPVEFEKRYFTQLDNVRKVWSEKSPAEREAFFAKRALLNAKAKAAQLEQEKQFDTAKSSLQEKVVSLQREYNIPDEEFWGNYQTLAKELVDRNVIKSTDEIEAEHVVNYSLELRRRTNIYEAAQQVGLEDDEKIEAISRVTASDPSLTVEDIVRLIKESGLVGIAPRSAVENLNKKAGQANSQFGKASSTKKEDKASGYDKEDLEYLYRNQPKGYSRVQVR